MAVLMHAFLGMGSVSEPGWAWGQLRREAQRAAGSGGSLGGGEARGVLGPWAAVGPGGGLAARSALPSTRSLKRTCCVRLRRRLRRLSMSGESRLSSTERTVMAFSWPPSPAGAGPGRGSRLTMAQGPRAAAAGHRGPSTGGRSPGLHPCPELPRAAGGLIPCHRGEGVLCGRWARGRWACCPPPGPTAPGTLPRQPCPPPCLPGGAGSPWSCHRLPWLSAARSRLPRAPGAGSPCPWLLGSQTCGDRERWVSPIPAAAAPRGQERPPWGRWPLPAPSQPRHHKTQRDKL